MYLYKQKCYSDLAHAADAMLSDHFIADNIFLNSYSISGTTVNFTAVAYTVDSSANLIINPEPITVNFATCTYQDPEFTENGLLGFEMTREEGALIAGMMVSLILISWGIGRAIDVIRHN